MNKIWKEHTLIPPKEKAIKYQIWYKIKSRVPIYTGVHKVCIPILSTDFQMIWQKHNMRQTYSINAMPVRIAEKHSKLFIV